MEREEGFSLKDLLMEEETLNQCKASNKELLTYLCRREVLQELIQYSVEFPKDQNDQDASQRFPFYSANILASGSDEIANALIKGGVIESKSEDAKEEAQPEKRELVIDDLNLDISGDGDENK